MKETKILSPKIDVVFQKLFGQVGNEEIKQAQSKWQIMEEGGRIILTDRLEIDIIELPKLSITEEKENEDLMNWLYFIENPENERVIEKMKENKELKQAKEELEKMSQDEYMQKIAELREKAILDEKSLYNTGYSDGIQEMEKKMQEMAKKMKSKKLPIELIVEITGLSKEEIEKL